MARPRTASEPVRKLTRVAGSSYYVTIPLDYIRPSALRKARNAQARRRIGVEGTAEGGGEEKREEVDY